jgi:protein-L-isoaspartate(D-aspartate) O-methyltransferase
MAPIVQNSRFNVNFLYKSIRTLTVGDLSLYNTFRRSLHRKFDTEDRMRKSLLLLLIVVFIAIVILITFPPARNFLSRMTKHQQNLPASPELVPSSITTEVIYAEDVMTEAREDMVASQIEARGIEDPAVLSAMRAVPRHEFVLPRMIDHAYEDTPLPIDYGQTISQPYIVALMTESLNLEPGMRVLEIGTGSGYQAAVLAEMGMDVYTVEIIPELGQLARQRLENLGYAQINTLIADGYFGWEQYAPYDAILVTAAPDHLPQPLVNQLVKGGRLIVPIGPVGAVQTLWLFENSTGELQATNLGAVRFVPLTGQHE